MTLEYILGFDPSAANTGWALLAPKDGFWDIAGYGSFSPKRMAAKDLKEFCEPEDIYRRAGDEAIKLIKALDLYDGRMLSNCHVGIEKVAFFALNKQSMAVGISTGVAIQIALWNARGIPAIPVVPTAWQAPIRVKGWSTKECSAFLAQAVYNVQDAPEDACDAIAVAHYIAHHRGYMDFIDETIGRLEAGVAPDIMPALGRKAVEAAKRAILTAPRGSRRLSKAFVKAHEEYVAALKNHRKLKGLDVAQSKLRQDFNLKAPALVQNNDALDRAMERLEVYYGRA